MTRILRTSLSNPLEREYEGWIVHGIEKYFRRLDIPVNVWSVSPSEESTWPADEQLELDGRIIGLQFKQAKLDVRGHRRDFSRLKWDFHRPRGQFDLVMTIPEIFYCLPTFINRNWRRQALDHCLFWRPSNQANRNAWYDNPDAQTPYSALKTKTRWGYFVEKICSREIGLHITDVPELNTFLSKVKARLSEVEFSSQEDEVEKKERSSLYLFYFSLGSS